MMRKIRTRDLIRRVGMTLLLFGLLVCSACGGDEDDTGSADGDGESSEVNMDGDVDIPSQNDNPMTSQSWKLIDTNAFQWYQAQALSELYLVISDDVFEHYFVRENETFCYRQTMTDIGVGRQAPVTDPDNCWYEFENGTTGQMTMTSRHRDDPAEQAEGWVFIFQSVTAVPDRDSSACRDLDECFIYSVQ